MPHDTREVDDASILANKETTKSYWESKLLEAAENQKNLLNKHIAADSLTPVITASVAQSPVANKDAKAVEMRSNGLVEDVKELRGGAVVSPPPEFRLNGKGSSDDVAKPLQQYVYGENGPTEDPAVPRHVNIIEQEIREQQMREAVLRHEGTLRPPLSSVEEEEQGVLVVAGEDDSGCAEFQEFDPTEPVVVSKPVIASAPVQLRPPSPVVVVAAHAAVPSAVGDDDGPEGIVAGGTPGTGDFSPEDLAPSSTYFDSPQFSTEAKIALEIRELKEREEELRRMRTRFNSASALHSQDNLISLPTSSSTDEGNCSEYGSGEDASNKEVASIEDGGSSSGGTQGVSVRRSAPVVWKRGEIAVVREAINFDLRSPRKEKFLWLRIESFLETFPRFRRTPTEDEPDFGQRNFRKPESIASCSNAIRLLFLAMTLRNHSESKPGGN
ncbi:unnamed protein product [Notodromas monacha]|uniref:Uncharacterized protein n=1 Tax=Notodromas monacha TaxID=399045 RepID=A0A7R9G946_9CRUS|nr:unnamed protein product [Notodromas monacha]CAG0913881.1 unnamed protein product [Notodromas monacha]